MSNSRTADFVSEMRSEIKDELFNEVLALLEPKITEMLYRNIFTFKEAYQYLKLSESTLRRLVKEENIPYYTLRGNFYFRQTDLDDFIDRRIIGKSPKNPKQIKE
jgi:excisionase family DNA binding protein